LKCDLSLKFKEDGPCPATKNKLLRDSMEMVQWCSLKVSKTLHISI
jgi:hypothetical protein